MSTDIFLIPAGEFRRVEALCPDPDTRLALLADMCRANALSVVKRAGSGHLGSSFSSMDIFVHLYYRVLNVRTVGVDSPDRDVFFSSKGHDVPGLYAVLYAIGVLPQEKFVNLRRREGLEGHPDVRTPGIEANSGSLGMGISKARGMAWAKRYLNRAGRTFVLVGDGELQEGQNYEGLQNAAHHGLAALTVIVDHNKVQTDRYVSAIADPARLIERFTAFGWHVQRCDGNDPAALGGAFRQAAACEDRPSLVVCDTVKGKGVSFMEHTRSMAGGREALYPWHAGAPGDEDFKAAHRELVQRVNKTLSRMGAQPVALTPVPPPAEPRTVHTLDGEQESLAVTASRVSRVSSTFVADAYGETLLELAPTRPDLVVLDADLAADCRVRKFEERYPDRFIECGIAEQDMVSTAGGLARQGLLPVVNSFAGFLTSRANEQIYNNASEHTKIIYACHYAGLIPAGPGKSHQSVRDISLLSALPNMVVVQPSCDLETRQVVRWAVTDALENVAIRLIIGPSPGSVPLPEGYRLAEGRGCTLTTGPDALVFAYGPVMIHEALSAAGLLKADGIRTTVVNMPWLNRVDPAWLMDTVGGHARVVVVEDHAPQGGLGDFLRRVFSTLDLYPPPVVTVMAVEGYPVFGTPGEALRHHGLDGASLARRIRSLPEP